MTPKRDRITELIVLADVDPEDGSARQWLEHALGALRPNPAAVKRRSPSEHNQPLLEVREAARALQRKLELLRMKPEAHAFDAFWTAPAFGPIRDGQRERPFVIATLNAIISAADDAMDPRKHRSREERKQQVVNRALGFVVRFSAMRPSSTETGPFAKFARQFYLEATGINPIEKGEGIDRQIRRAVKERLSIEIERVNADKSSPK